MNDILLGKDNDLLFEEGDFVIGNSDKQNQKLIIAAGKGEFKAHPEVGVGIEGYLNDESFTPLLIEIKKQLEYDGMKINDVFIDEEDKLVIDGKYKENGKV